MERSELKTDSYECITLAGQNRKTKTIDLLVFGGIFWATYLKTRHREVWDICIKLIVRSVYTYSGRERSVVTQHVCNSFLPLSSDLTPVTLFIPITALKLLLIISPWVKESRVQFRSKTCTMVSSASPARAPVRVYAGGS